MHISNQYVKVNQVANEKGNYRLINILQNLSKLFESCMLDQLDKYFDKILSKYC